VERIVVVGGGLAGARTVEALRGRGYRGRLTLLGAEPHRPYDRPPLSKALLLGGIDDTTLAGSYDGVELRLGEPAVGLAPEVVITDGGRVDYDGLVIATGAAPVPVGDALTLRTVQDARRLRSRLTRGARVAIVGAGWIGAEVAFAARRLGCAVTVLEAAPAPLAAALGDVVGRATLGWYDGIDLRLDAPVASVTGSTVLLADGEVIAADVVIAGIGVRSGATWAGHPGVIATDQQLRVAPGVFAVGDAASWPSRRFGARLSVQHWDNALHAPDMVAAALLGDEEVSYDPVPYFWSEQFGHVIQYAGWHGAADTFCWRGTPTVPPWTGCWLRAGVLEAIVTCDRPRDLLAGRRLIAARAEPDLDRLADPALALKALARAF
jgi:3-phenylpropionate/trans-cinnamate dioxygenase ferredoxin reductase component